MMTARGLRLCFGLGVVTLAAVGSRSAAQTPPPVPFETPQAAVDALLAADQQFGAEAAKMTAIPALAAMFADDVVMPVGTPTPGFARGKPQAIEALKTNPDNAAGRLAWGPQRAGISADGQHGFTVGYMTLTRADGSPVPIKYVAYWIKRPEGWRVAVYKRVRADRAPDAREMMAPALPDRIVPPTTDAATLAKHKLSLELSEKLFSDQAQTIGLGAAFAKYGSADAVNVGPPTSPSFIVGAVEIGKSVGAGSEGKPSPVAWAADAGVIVASSGDLGVTFGFIRQNTPREGKPSESAPIPFITIWRRAGPSQPWRYVAE